MGELGWLELYFFWHFDIIDFFFVVPAFYIHAHILKIIVYVETSLTGAQFTALDAVSIAATILFIAPGFFASTDDFSFLGVENLLEGVFSFERVVHVFTFLALAKLVAVASVLEAGAVGLETPRVFAGTSVENWVLIVLIVVIGFELVEVLQHLSFDGDALPTTSALDAEFLLVFVAGTLVPVTVLAIAVADVGDGPFLAHFLIPVVVVVQGFEVVLD